MGEAAHNLSSHEEKEGEYIPEQHDTGRTLTPQEMKLLSSIPSPDEYKNKDDAETIRVLKKLPADKQLKILKELGINEENPLSISGHFRRALLDAVATIGFKTDAVEKGRSKRVVYTPTGGKRK